MGVYTNLPIPRDTQHPCEGNDQRWAKHVDRIFLSQSSFPGLFDHFIIAWGIRTTSLICWIIDFKGNCDPCSYYVLLLRPQVCKRLALLGAESSKSTFGSKVELQLQERLSVSRALSWLPASGARDLKVSLCHGCVSYLRGEKPCW